MQKLRHLCGTCTRNGAIGFGSNVAKFLGTLPKGWLRGVDLNHRPLGYKPNELPDCSTPQG